MTIGVKAGVSKENTPVEPITIGVKAVDAPLEVMVVNTTRVVVDVLQPSAESDLATTSIEALPTTEVDKEEYIARFYIVL